jgi:hypothetical protein
MATQARELVDARFSLEAMVSQYEALYERLIAARERRAVPAPERLQLDRAGTRE